MGDIIVQHVFSRWPFYNGRSGFGFGFNLIENESLAG
jgi:hypothetical protein